MDKGETGVPSAWNGPQPQHRGAPISTIWAGTVVTLKMSMNDCPQQMASLPKATSGSGGGPAPVQGDINKKSTGVPQAALATLGPGSRLPS